MVGQKIAAGMIALGVTGSLASEKIQKTELIPGFSEYSAEYTLLASVFIGFFGALIMLVLGMAKIIQRGRFNKKVLEETERHNRIVESINQTLPKSE